MEITRLVQARIWNKKEPVVSHVWLDFGIVHSGQGLIDDIELAVLVVFKISFVYFTQDMIEISFCHVISTVV